MAGSPAALTFAALLLSGCLVPGRARAASEMFPPVERILSGLGSGSPLEPAVEPDLRDSPGPAKDVAWLRRELQHDDWDRRRSAVEQAGRPANDAAVPYLGAVVLGLNEDPRVRVAAAVALARIGHPSSARFLGEALRGDPEVDVRFAAALALGAGFEGTAGSLCRSLREDGSWWVRYAAAVALGRAAGPGGEEPLAEAAAGDAAWQVRLEATRALGSIRSPRSAKALARPLADPDPGVRAAAAMALGEVGGEPALRALQAALGEETDSFQRRVLTQALQKVLARL
ncbi:MAG: HEAT repeat domain-containing protein [Elusimicrobia bacterium]|nr:HEAT repeat domain-containing protein [Elusimicrobiota bacterium]